MDNKKNFYIDGRWVTPNSKKEIKVINPATEEDCAVISLGNKEDVDQIDPTSCFRLAPLCFLGQSLFETGQGQSPYQAAALGAAIIVGPFVGAHKADYDRLDEVGGLRRVIDPNELATAVLQMSGPEQAAQTSLAAWTVVSQGAEVTDALTALALDQLGS